MNLASLMELFVQAGAQRVYAKPLAKNDNSKNQVYLSGAVDALNAFPSRQIFGSNTNRGPSFKAILDFGWLLENGRIAPAPEAKLILYAQYPEVRFSGFLRGCQEGPHELMMDRAARATAQPEVLQRLDGRILFLAVTGDGRVLGYVAAGHSALAMEFSSRSFPPAFVVFREVPLPSIPDASDSRALLLAELRRINALGWIDSKQLDGDGSVKPCRAQQCGGFTLEAELGIPKNSISGPDYLGWEVKQHSVTRHDRSITAAAITLLTPEPTVGFYRDRGVEAFVRAYGYPDARGRTDRLNFGGIHRVGQIAASTGLLMQLTGYDTDRDIVTDANGAIELISASGEVAAGWPFSGLLAHWSRKHTRAVYVPSMRRTIPDWQYFYGRTVRLAQGTNPLRLLSALALGAVYYDPGIKLEHASTTPLIKRRNQFRIASKNIAVLYDSIEQLEA